MPPSLTESEMIRLWERHTELEFATKDAVATVATMTPDNYVNHVPVMTGGRGRDEMIDFYGRHFIPRHACRHITPSAGPNSRQRPTHR